MKDLCGFSTTTEVCKSIVVVKISELLLLAFSSAENKGRDNLFFLILATCLTEWPSSVRALEILEVSVEWCKFLITTLNGRELCGQNVWSSSSVLILFWFFSLEV